MVYITAGSEMEASRIAALLVEKRLAACVAVVSPIRSVYRWKGEIHDEPETMLIAKTLTGKFELLKNAVLAAHSYEVPEIVAVPMLDGHQPYLDWVRESVDG